MGAQLESRGKRFFAGDDSDDLPEPGRMFDGSILQAQDIPVGSTVLYASGKMKRWTGSEWVASEPDTTTEELLAAILDELRGIRLAMELATAD